MSPSRYAELRTQQIQIQIDAAPPVLPGVLAAVGTGLVSILFAAQLVYGWSL